MHNHEAEKRLWEFHESFETSISIPSDTRPPTGPNLLILPKQFDKFGTKYSNIWVFGLTQTTTRRQFDIITIEQNNNNRFHPRAYVILNLGLLASITILTWNFPLWSMPPILWRSVYLCQDCLITSLLHEWIHLLLEIVSCIQNMFPY